MEPFSWPTAAVIIVAFISLGGAALAAFGGNRKELTAREEAERVRLSGQVTDLRAELAECRDDLDQQSEEFKRQLAAQRIEFEARWQALERHTRIQDDYVFKLRSHIADGLGPPPPEYPAELRRP